jgi:D-tyrosyl-tRNA(Tyr) deacylase
MRAVLQRVSKASVSIEGAVHSEIANGFLVLLGIETEDSTEDIDYLCQKISQMRVFSDAEGKMNLDIQQTNGSFLVVSQFTLHASTKKGNRPSFIKAARPEQAIPLYEQFLSTLAAQSSVPVKSGVFAADMQIALVNDGPVTIFMDSKNKE